jgi:hypothetical protein
VEGKIRMGVAVLHEPAADQRCGGGDQEGAERGKDAGERRGIPDQARRRNEQPLPERMVAVGVSAAVEGREA